ncbi:hypothetical protein BD779DRAFT_1518190, partial [Infundibulicybe gibba]
MCHTESSRLLRSSLARLCLMPHAAALQSIWSTVVSRGQGGGMENAPAEVPLLAAPEGLWSAVARAFGTGRSTL